MRSSRSVWFAVSVATSFEDTEWYAALCGALDVPLRELGAAPVRVEAHDEAVVVHLVHRASGVSEIGAAARGHRDVAVHCDGAVAGVVGALGVAPGPARVVALAEPRIDDRLASHDRLVARGLGTAAVPVEERRGLVPVLALPGPRLGVKP